MKTTCPECGAPEGNQKPPRDRKFYACGSVYTWQMQDTIEPTDCAVECPRSPRATETCRRILNQ